MLNNSKEQALFRLLNDYTDVLGAATLYDKSQSNPLAGRWDSENQHLWSGEIALLIVLNNLSDSIYTEKIIANFSRHLLSCSIDMNGIRVPGLYSRHPMYLYRNHPDFNNLSHDEFSGIMFLVAATGQRHIAKEILEYGRAHNYCYFEEDPGYDAIKESGGLLKKLFSKKDEKLISGLSRILQGKDRAFIKLMAGESAPWYEYIQLMLNLALSSTRRTTETSGRLLSFYKIKSLDLIEHESVLFRLVKMFVRRKMISDYGPEYLEAITSVYFKDQQSPMHELAKGVRL